jgi:hypothetical protein
MIPREHLPLTLVTFALVGLIFLMYREVNAVKTAVAQLSVPPPALTLRAERIESDDEEEDEEEENDEAETVPSKTAVPATRAAAAMHAVRNRENSSLPETALPRVSKPIANSSSKDSALKLKK